MFKTEIDDMPDTLRLTAYQSLFMTYCYDTSLSIADDILSCSLNISSRSTRLTCLIMLDHACKLVLIAIYHDQPWWGMIHQSRTWLISHMNKFVLSHDQDMYDINSDLASQFNHQHASQLSHDQAWDSACACAFYARIVVYGPAVW